MLKVNFYSNGFSFYYGEIKEKSRYLCIFANMVLCQSVLKKISSIVFSHNWTKLQKISGLYFASSRNPWGRITVQRHSDQISAVIAQAQAIFRGVTSIVSFDGAKVDSAFFSAPKVPLFEFLFRTGPGLSEILMNREIGLSRGPALIHEAFDRILEGNLTRDCFEYARIELPNHYNTRTFRCGEFLAVTSMKRVSFWSLFTQSKLWEVEIPREYYTECLLNESGLVLLNKKIIVLNGKQTGILPNYNWLQLDLIGTRIFGHGKERDQPYFFGEWDASGNCLRNVPLDYPIRGNSIASDENYWIHLISSQIKGLPHIAEIVNLSNGNMDTVRLPLLSDDEQIISACVHKNVLIFGRFGTRPIITSSICLYDLVKREILEEIPTGEGHPKQIVSNEQFIAWELDSLWSGGVNCYNRREKTIKSFKKNNEECSLELNGNILSVTYSEPWHRMTINLNDWKITRVKYRHRQSYSESFSYSKGIVLFTSPPAVFIENFVGKRHTNRESAVRVK